MQRIGLTHCSVTYYSQSDPEADPLMRMRRIEDTQLLRLCICCFTTVDQAPSAEETKPFEADESAATPPPHPAYRVTARISIPAPVPTPVWSDAEVARLLAISTLPLSPLFP
ncbi:hypothetical protein Tco_0496720 [Tanacetum coccineum]